VVRLTIKAGDKADIPSAPGTPEQVHVFSAREILAIETAIAARRALLVRGEPGTGKTQLAKAAAVVLKRAFVSFVVDSRSESRDLLWHFDAVARLADAQVYGALLGRRGDLAPSGSDEAEVLKDLRAKLDTDNFIHPRALWLRRSHKCGMTFLLFGPVILCPQADLGDDSRGSGRPWLLW